MTSCPCACATRSDTLGVGIGFDARAVFECQVTRCTAPSEVQCTLPSPPSRRGAKGKGSWSYRFSQGAPWSDQSCISSVFRE